jgi:hypothetical protein
MNVSNQKTLEWTSFALSKTAWQSLWNHRIDVCYISFFTLFLPLLGVRMGLIQDVWRLKSQADEITNVLSAPVGSILNTLALNAQALLSKSAMLSLGLWPIATLGCLYLIHLSLGRKANLVSLLKNLITGMIFTVFFTGGVVLGQPIFIVQFAFKVLATVAPIIIIAENMGAFKGLVKAISTKYLSDTTQTGLGLFFTLATPHALLSILYDLLTSILDYWTETTIYHGNPWFSPGVLAIVLRSFIISVYIPFSIFLAATIYLKARKSFATVT